MVKGRDHELARAASNSTKGRTIKKRQKLYLVWSWVSKCSVKTYTINTIAFSLKYALLHNIRYRKQGVMLQPKARWHVYNIKCSARRVTRAPCNNLYTYCLYTLQTWHIIDIWDGEWDVSITLKCHSLLDLNYIHLFEAILTQNLVRWTCLNLT